MGKNNQGLFQSDQVTHYKMYKKGRYWLFAGVVLVTMWQGSSLVQADEVKPAETSIVSQVTSAADSTEKPTATVKEDPGSQTPKVNVTATGSAKNQLSSQSDYQTDQDASQAPKSQDPSSAAPVKSELKVADPVAKEDEQSPDKVVESGLETSQLGGPVKEQSAGPTNTAQPSLEEPAKPELQGATPAIDGQQPDKMIEPEEKGVATGQSETPVQEQPAESITTEKPSSTVPEATEKLLLPADSLTDAGGMMTSMLRTNKASRLLRDAAEPVVTEVATGNVWGGTSQWTLNSDGVLHIGAGTFGSNPETTTSNNIWQRHGGDIKSIIFDGTVIAGTSMSWLFERLDNLTTITNINRLNTSQVTRMEDVFGQDMKLERLDLNSWDVSKVTDMTGIFRFNSALTDLKISDWNTTSLEQANFMFYYDTSLKELDVSKWKTNNLRDAANMFGGLSGVSKLNLNNWDTGNLEDAWSMFLETMALTDLEISNWNTSNVIHMNNMFAISGVKDLDLHKWDVSKVQTLTKMFQGTSLDTLNISGWDLNSVTDLLELFQTVSIPIDIVNLKASNVTLNEDITSLASLFSSLTSLKTINLSGWDLSNITDLTDLFANDTALETIIADNWDLSNFKEIKPLFSGLDNLTTVSAKNWNLPQLTDLTGLFAGYQKLAKVDASGWQIDHVTSLKDMFSNLPNLTDVNVSNWQTGQVTDMSNMFANDSSLSTLDLSSLDTSSVTTLDDMLAGTNQLSKLVLGAKTRLTVNGTSANLPDIVADPNVYNGNTGYWINSKYDQFTSKNLLNLTDPAVLADTFVWQKNLSSLTVKDSFPNQTVPNQWQPADNLVAGTDLNGQPLLLSKVTSSGIVDTTIPKTYTVTYQYIDAVGRPVTATATIQVIASKVAVTAHDTTLTQNQKWTAHDSLDGALEFDGQPADLERVAVIGDDKVDLKTPGTYTVTYQYTDANGNQAQKQITVTVVKSKVGIDAKDATLVQGQSWTAKDSFVQAQTVDGQPVTDFNQVTVVNADKVDTKTPGTYQVTYHYTDIYGNEATKMITVTVVKSKVGIDAKDATIVQGQSWTAQDSFEQAQMFDGQNMTDFSQVMVVGTDKVDTKTPGTYQVTYHYTDIYGNEATKMITVTVVKSKVGIDAKDATIVQGQSWTAQDSFEQAQTFDGQNMTDFSQVMVVGTDKVDTKTPGTYQVTYHYTDIYGNVATKTITVAVIKSQVGISAKDTKLIQGQNWTAQDSFVKAQTFDGQTVTDFNQVTVLDADKVDTKTPGTYRVTYRYTDIYGNVATKTITVTVVKSQVGVVAHDTTIIQGQKWAAKDSFDRVVTFDGQVVSDFNQVTVIDADKVDTKTPGTYQVIYRYTDIYGNVATQTINVTVKTSQYSLAVKNVVVKQGEAWTSADSFIGATDATGQTVSLDHVKVTGADLVDTSKPGTYAVSYLYTDAFGNQVTKTVSVTVVVDNNTGDGGNGGTPIDPDDNHDGGGNNGETPTEPDDNHDSDSDNGGLTTEPGDTSTDSGSADHQSNSEAKSNDNHQNPTSPITTVVADGVQNDPQPVLLTKQVPINKATQLPQTDENTTKYGAIVGAIMMGMLGLTGFFGKHRHEEQ